MPTFRLGDRGSAVAEIRSILSGQGLLSSTPGRHAAPESGKTPSAATPGDIAPSDTHDAEAPQTGAVIHSTEDALFDIDVDHGVLTLTAQRSAPSDDGVQWLASERFSGTYRRQVSLGEGIDVTKIVANYDNGVLSVTIPLAEEAKPRKIVVESTGRQQAITANASG